MPSERLEIRKDQVVFLGFSWLVRQVLYVYQRRQIGGASVRNVGSSKRVH